MVRQSNICNFRQPLCPGLCSPSVAAAVCKLRVLSVRRHIGLSVELATEDHIQAHNDMDAIPAMQLMCRRPTRPELQLQRDDGIQRPYWFCRRGCQQAGSGTQC